MKTKTLLFMILISLSLLVTGCSKEISPEISSFEACVAAGNPIMESYPRQCSANGQHFVENLDVEVDISTDDSAKPIGGQRDEHGCLNPAGYSWDSEIGACTRSWELDESQKEAAKIAIAHLSYPVTITEVEVLRCPGCFIVHIQRNDNQQMGSITLNDWKIN